MLKEKEFLDYFSELKGRPEEEQISLIGRARYEMFVKQGRNGKVALITVFSLLIGFMVASLPWLVGSETLLHKLSLIPIGVLVSIGVYKRLYGRLLKQGLMHVLEQQS